jgi:hypothetical protein
MCGPVGVSFVVTEACYMDWVGSYEIGTRLARATACASVRAGRVRHLASGHLVQYAGTGEAWGTSFSC